MSKKVEPNDKVLLYPDPLLQVPSPITDWDDEAAEAARICTEALVAYGQQALAVAAPQIGILRRLFVMRDLHSGEPIIIFEPEESIDKRSEETWRFSEGCLSIPGYFWPIDRPRRITVQWLDGRGELLEAEIEDLEARVFQHEIDHLDGILLVDRIPAGQRKQLDRKIAKRQTRK